MRALGKCADGNGESRDGLRGKRTQLGLGSWGNARELRRGEVRIDRVPNAGRKCLREGDESCQCRVFDLGSCVKGRATGPRHDHGTGACEWSLRPGRCVTVSQA